jgi:hypothetical protein
VNYEVSRKVDNESVYFKKYHTVQWVELLLRDCFNPRILKLTDKIRSLPLAHSLFAVNGYEQGNIV